MSPAPELRVLCVSGPSGSGKTTLVRRLLSALPSSLAPVAVIKHTHHAIDWHPAGKDSGVLWEAGPSALCVAGPDQTALFLRSDRGDEALPSEATADAAPPLAETPDGPAPDDPSAVPTRRLVRACRRLRGDARLALAEGFGEARAPKVWTAAGPPDGAIGPGVRAAVVPARHAAAWAERHPELAVHRRGEIGEIARRLAGLAEPLPAIAGPAAGRDGHS